MAKSPTIVGLCIAPNQSVPLTAVEALRAVAGRGLEGDRYYLNNGFYSNKPGWGANVTLIESEAIAAVNVGHNTEFTFAMLRRNVVTANVQLDSLIGRQFRCGQAILRGVKPFPPCAHLAYLLGQPLVLKYFAYCGGIGAEVIADGEIRLGDAIEIIE